MDEEDFVGCISCMSTNDLCDLFASFSEHVESYAKTFENCFNIKMSNDSKYICVQCVQKLEDAATFKEQTEKSIAIIESIKDEEYLDETILEEGDGREKTEAQDEIVIKNDTGSGEGSCDYDNLYDLDDEHAIQALDETTCIYCNLTLASEEEVSQHIRNVHGLEPRTGLRLRNCSICGVSLMDATDHYTRCHGTKSNDGNKQFPCHFCDNIYNSRKACFTHLRMKHGLKLSTDQGPKYAPRERKKCHMCNRDFSQKQILNKHLWKAHRIEVEKRKAFICPLCPTRVSYGTQFSQHLLKEHHVQEQVERLEFLSIDDFMLYKSAVQEETKYRFRKTTASKQTIEGLRSHYMCSQSGVYVYQGKGKRPAPERQIYKTGKACPAHLIVTETLDRVLVTFHKTHVGHGTCPYYEPREPKKLKLECETSIAQDEDQTSNLGETKPENTLAWICDTCGMGFLDTEKFKRHVSSHGNNLFPCQYCDNVFQNIDAWTRHLRIEHKIGALF